MKEVIKDRLTKDEKQILAGYSSRRLYKDIAMAMLWAFFLISCISFVVSFPLWKLVAPYLGIPKSHLYKGVFIVLSCGVGVAFVSFVMWKDFRYARKENDAYADLCGKAATDLQEGIALVHTFNVLDAVEIAEYEDEGAGFFLELEDGQVLCVIGQDLYDYAHDAEADPGEGIEDMRHLFPQTKIEYRVAPASGLRLRVKGVGASLPVSAVVKSHKGFFRKGKGGVSHYTGPEDGVFYPGGMEDVLKQFELAGKDDGRKA